MQNPFTLVFGRCPLESISRLAQTNEIIESFSAEFLNQQIYMITGVRGSGKTVMLTDISKHFKSKKDWIVIELNPDRDMLQGFAAKLYDYKDMKDLFIKAKIDLSVLGIGVSIEKSNPFFDIENAIQAMLEIVKKRNKRILISIDEVTSNIEMQIFASTFQILVRNEYPVFLLITGLFENIDALQNEKNLTFLYRAPKIKLRPLDKGAVNLGIANTPSEKIKDIRDRLSLKTNEFNPYRDRLKKKGIIDCEERGYVSFILPEFTEYVKIHA